MRLAKKCLDYMQQARLLALAAAVIMVTTRLKERFSEAASFPAGQPDVQRQPEYDSHF